MNNKDTIEYTQGYEDYYKGKAYQNPYNHDEDFKKYDDYEKGYKEAELDDEDDLDDVF